MAKPWLYFENVAYGKRNNSVRIVQNALRKQFGGIVVDGYFGAQSKEYYACWQRHLGYQGKDADGVPGMQSLTKMGQEYGFDIRHVPDKPKPAPERPKVNASNYESQPEPPMNMSRTWYGGRLVNQRTKVLLERAAEIYGQDFTLTQGSYNTGVRASAGTHDGGGVVDINTDGLNIAKAVLALRKAGFAAWHRTPAQGFSHHIHACAIGDRQMAWLARSQVQSYFNRRDGLARNYSDNSEHRWPNWCDQYR
jgi:hypothetical protein